MLPILPGVILPGAICLVQFCLVHIMLTRCNLNVANYAISSFPNNKAPLLRSRWWICRALFCSKECFPPTSQFRFRTFSPLIVAAYPELLTWCPVTKQTSIFWIVLFSAGFDIDQDNPNMPPHPNPVQRGNWHSSQTNLGIRQDFCSLLGPKGMSGQVSETCHYEADSAGAKDKGPV